MPYKNQFLRNSQKLNLHNTSKEFLFVVIGQIVAAAGSLIGVRLLTQQITPTSYGEISLGLTIGVLFQQTLFGPLSGSYLRYFSIAKEKNEIPEFLSGVRKTSIQSIIISALVFIGIIIFIFFKHWNNYLLLIVFSFLYMLFSSLNNYLDNLQNAARQRTVVAWHQGVGTWLRYLLAILAIYLLGSTSTNAAFGYALSAILVFLSQMFFFFHSNYFTINNQSSRNSIVNSKNWEKDFWAYAQPFMIWGIFTWAQLSSDRWALSLFSSTSDVGLFTVLYQLGYYPISFLSGILLQYISPILFQWTGDATEEKRTQKSTLFVRNLVIYSLIFGFAITIFTLAFHKEIFILFVASQYRQVSYLLPWMALSGSIFASGQFATMYYLNTISPQRLLLPKIFTAILGTALNFVSAMLFGLRGIIFASLVFSTVYLILILFLPKIQSGGISE